MKVAKRFRWEGAHRLPWHQGSCANLHGHSYRMVVELEGKPDERGMLIDFKEIKRVLGPLVDAFDHATLVAESDEELLDVIRAMEWKHHVLPFDSTSENLASYVIDYLGRNGYESLVRHDVSTIRVRLEETETCYAEMSRPVSAYASSEKGDEGVGQWEPASVAPAT